MPQALSLAEVFGGSPNHGRGANFMGRGSDHKIGCIRNLGPKMEVFPRKWGAWVSPSKAAKGEAMS